MTQPSTVTFNLDQLWTRIRDQLREQGIDLEGQCCAAGDGPRLRVVCVAPDLKEALAEASRSPRDQVVMVRVDEDTLRDLDAWVETGTMKSRSEAAAVFIREGLKLRSKELEQLSEAVAEVEAARERLRRKAAEVLGGGDRPQP